MQPLLLPIVATLLATAQRKISIGIPIGIVNLPPQHVQSFRNLCKNILDQPIPFRGVAKDQKDLVTIHLPPLVAASLDEKNVELLQFLKDNAGEYVPGVRRKCPTLKLNFEPTQNHKHETSKFRFVELFAGIGGFRLGLEQIGGQCILSNEIDEGAAAIYRLNFASANNCLAVGDVVDIATENIPEFDCLVGGFPCQPFSSRGDQQGFADDRGQLYRELARLLQEKQPKCFMFENVPGLVTLEGGKRYVLEKGSLPIFEPGTVFERVLDTFRSCGYQVDWKVLNSRKWLPQMRERVYIVGWRNDLKPFQFDWDNLLLKDLLDENPSIVRDILEPKESPSVLSSVITEKQFATLKSKRGEEIGRIDIHSKAPTLISQYHTVRSFTTKFIWEEADGTMRERPRFLTPRECTRLMGFPEEFRVPTDYDTPVALAQYYQAIGNAVCPIVIASIGNELIQCMDDGR